MQRLNEAMGTHRYQHLIQRDAKELQTLLGEHQDCMVAADFLARMSSDTGEIAFTHRS
jgi:hypothetical protein